MDLILKNVRVSYAHLNEAYAYDNEEPKYSMKAVIEDPKEVDNLKSAIILLAEDKANWESGKVPKTYEVSLLEGNENDPVEAGFTCVNLKSKYKPQIVDMNNIDIEDPSEIYSGMYTNVQVRLFTYTNAGRSGVAFGLGHIQKVRDAEKLSTLKTAQEVFGGGKNDELPF